MANPVVGMCGVLRLGCDGEYAQTLDELGVAYEAKVVSAHRT